MAITLQKKYQQERERRLNDKGLSQYLDKFKTAGYILQEDPWVAEGTPVQYPVPDGGHVKILVLGAGLGGLCAAARALLTGSASSPADLLIVDRAGGFGGTWWHNRYPGLMCDIESYVYLPLLEETGYMPKRKYSSGEEIRQYADLLAQKFGLHERAMFQTSGNSLTWDAKAKTWICKVAPKPKGQIKSQAQFTADYVVIASGGFTDPKVPDVPGLPEYQGKMLHTGRWNYDITGGSAADPILDALTGKKVAIIGTGATAIQVVPATAKYAEELYVFQRTASAVDVRGNRDTDPEEWKTKIANEKGWQGRRSINFQAFTEGQNNLPAVNHVNDGWTSMPTISAAWGTSTEIKPEDTADYISAMNELDSIRSDRVRQRALDVVKNVETAEALQAWYPGWCKRPTFHDEYLEAFNGSNVHLVDTAPRGVEALTAKGIRHNGTEYPIDVIIWSTGYGSPLTESLAGKAGITVIGKDGLNMDDRFKEGKLMALHGLIAHGFPNLFYPGFSQAGVGVNQTQRLDDQSLQIAYMIKESELRAKSQKIVIEPTEDACENWGDKCAAKAHLLATMANCTPSYFNAEGASDRMTSEQQAGAARAAIWGQGYLSYAKVLADWRASGELEGLEISAA